MAIFSEFAEFEWTKKPHQGLHVLEEGPHEFDEVLMELMKEPEVCLQLSGQQYPRAIDEIAASFHDLSETSESASHITTRYVEKNKGHDTLGHSFLQ